MNWGSKIAIAYGSFVVMMLYFIYVANRQSNDLVEDHYYEKELQFQKELNANENYSRLQSKPEIIKEKDQLKIQLPDQGNTNPAKGKIEFIRMSDKSQDISEIFEKGNRTILIPLSKFHTGHYQLHMEWTSDGNSYQSSEPYNYY